MRTRLGAIVLLAAVACSGGPSPSDLAGFVYTEADAPGGSASYLAAEAGAVDLDGLLAALQAAGLDDAAEALGEPGLEAAHGAALGALGWTGEDGETGVLLRSRALLLRGVGEVTAVSARLRDAFAAAKASAGSARYRVDEVPPFGRDGFTALAAGEYHVFYRRGPILMWFHTVERGEAIGKRGDGMNIAQYAEVFGTRVDDRLVERLGEGA